MILKTNFDNIRRFTGCGALVLLASTAACGDDGGSNSTDTGHTHDVEDTGIGDVPSDAATGCDVTPGVWSADGFETNAAGALAMRDAIVTLQDDIMNTAEQVTWGDEPVAAPTLEDLTAAYEAGDPSIKDMTAPALDALIQQTFEDWVEALDQDPATYLFINVDGTEWVATGAGGVHERPAADDGTRRFRAYGAGGVELRQLVDKGLFVGTLYNYALSLTEGEITPATIHALAAAYGANPDLEASPAEGEPGLEDSANYARTMGLFDEAAAALTDAQAYAGDASCEVERDAAIVEFFRYWEEAMFARGTYYAGAPWRATLDPTDPDTLFDPLHGAAEGWGLIAGMLDIEDPASGPLSAGARISTNEEIITLLEANGLDLDDLSAGTTGEWLVESPSTYSDGFTGTFKTTVQDIFGWDEDTFEVYSTSPVANE
jgi:hypothetical protein